MADNSTASSNNNKRNSMAGKVATPKTGGSSPAMQPLADSLESLSKAIEAKVKISTAAPHSQTYEGTLFTADPILNIVAINTSPSPASSAPQQQQQQQLGDYHIIPVSRIQSFQILSLAENGDGSLAGARPAIGALDVKQLRQREETRIAKLKEEELDRGKGVTKEAQDIFDAFKRINIPVRWHNTEMIVSDLVMIAAPYRPEDCRAAPKNQDNLVRIRKILEAERKKLKEREEKERKATPTGPRKGG